MDGHSAGSRGHSPGGGGKMTQVDSTTFKKDVPPVGVGACAPQALSGVADVASGVPQASDLLPLACEDLGRCLGCPRGLAQLEAIVRHQGEESLSALERSHLLRRRILLAADAPMSGESETSRQGRIVARVTEVLVDDGCSPSDVHAAVWNRGKSARKTFSAWLAAARAELMERTS